MKRILFNAEAYHSFGLNLGLLVFRLFIGLTMAFAHGLGKIPPNEMFTGFVTSMGMPAFMAWGAALAEFGGGLFIALGLATRLSGIGLACTMAVAAFMAHGADPFQKKEMALIYLFTSIFFVMAGPGKFSIDSLISRK